MINVGEDIEQQEISFHCWWEYKIVQPLWDTIWWFLTKLNIVLLSGTVFTLLDIYPSKLKTYVHTKTSTCMLWGVFVSLHMNVYSSFIYNCPNLEVVKMSLQKVNG